MRKRTASTANRVAYYTRIVQKTILELQHPVTGLIADSATKPDAWIRDNVYAILAVWSLSLAYRKSSDSDTDRAKAYEFEQCVVRLMRGLLRCFMLQKDKLERFKENQNPLDALHAKYDSRDCGPIVADDKWGHLQMDAISLYLLILAETTTSGLQIVQTLDEVAFVQNLVFYIEASYRIPDYGIWERGDKTNHGLTELNATSIGMAHAALRSLDGLNLFGAQGGSASLIHCLPDETSMCHAVLVSMLPRESVSKEVDAALLAVIGYPAFAVNDRYIVEKTKNEVRSKLEGLYGCKRFLRDGYKTVLEDPNRLHYELHELRTFENIECEWPIFFVYLALGELFSETNNQNSQQGQTQLQQQTNGQTHNEAANFIEKVESLTVQLDGINIVPELYRVELKDVELERKKPGSQPRTAWGRMPHKWAQSLYIVARMVFERLISPGELDPLNRRMITQTQPEIVTQVVIVGENSAVKEILAHYGVECQTRSETSPIHVHRARVLSYLYSHLGKNKRLGLSGRASNELGVLSTSKLYILHDEVFAFTPSFFDQEVFYLGLDTEYLIDLFTTTVAYLNKNWTMLGRPTVVLPIQQSLLEQSEDSKKLFISALQTLQSGIIGGHRVQVGTLKQFTTTSCVSRLSFLEHSEHFSKSSLDLFIKLNSAHTHGRLASMVPNVSIESSHDDTKLSDNDNSLTRDFGRHVARKVAGIVSRRRSSVYPSVNRTSTDYDPDNRATPLSADLSNNKDKVDSVLAPFVPLTELSLEEFLGSVENHDSNYTMPQRLARPSSSSPGHHAPPTFMRTNSFDPALSPMSTTPKARPSNLLVTMHPSPSSLGATQLAMQTDANELIESLKETSSLHEQADLIHCLYLTKGLDWVTPLGCPVKDLVSECGDRAAELREWWLVRHTSGVLRRRPHDLAKCLTDLLVRGKQVSIGLLPDINEKVITSPLPPDELENLIYATCNGDPTLTVVTQELLVDLSMLIKSEPRLFSNMLRIRVGLITQVMASELGAMMSCNPEEATHHLFNLSPFQMKALLSRVLSGSELAPSDKSMRSPSSMSVGQMVTLKASKRSFARQASHFAKELAEDHVNSLLEKKSSTTTIDNDQMDGIFSFERSVSNQSDTDSISSMMDGEIEVGEIHRKGQWFRRRRLDGSLNKVPIGFYASVWRLLERCDGIVLYDRHIPSSLTREMTEHELKFALHIEAALNRVPDPNYRQLFVEALSVLSTVSEHDNGRILFQGVLHIDRLIAAANDLFLEEQSSIEEGSAKQCCANFGSNYRRKNNKESCSICHGPAGICAYFYDSAPSGRCGTLTYLTRAALYAFALRSEGNNNSKPSDCAIS